MAKIHGTDTKAVQRALTSLCQHVDALNLESKGMSQGIGSFETDLVTPDCIAEELTTLGLLTGGLVGVHHLIRLTPFKDITALYRGFWVAGAVYMTWRLGSGALRRLAAITLNNRRRKRELQNIWAGVDERIQIMQSLASTAPAVSQSQHAQMPSMPAASQSLPHASYPPVEDLSVDTFPGAAKTRTALAAERMAQAGALSREKASLAED
ncbi:hypothetical protein WJX75_001885 [Coccomyxa subellipsoidea]|uniref:Uncharacterized protein n=1 Tax=Coccomyxa subellipsoidea TaxID=248742 RepID=A0ABR2YBD6_9CHLO